MSKFRATGNHISQKGFAHLPNVGETVPGQPQSRSSLQSGSTSGSVPGISAQHTSLLQEGDLVTGTVDIAHERVHMLPAIRDPDRAEEKRSMEQYIISLGIIPPSARGSWTLDHDSNTTFLSPHFHRHHDIYATILIAPSAEDSIRISDRLARDNNRRAHVVKAGGTDPGRAEGVDWFEGTNGEYELVIIRPAHFLIGDFPVVIKHPITQKFARFYVSEFKDGVLCEGSSTGAPLPPFRSRGEIDRGTPLNPVLVNFAAMVRLRRLIRQDPTWGSTLCRRVTSVLERVVRLHAAILWDPQQSMEAQFIIKVPGSQPPLFRDLRDWPYRRASSGPPQPHNPTPLDYAFALIEAGFEELPDLGGGGGESHHPDLPSELGVMMPQEKMERFLAGL